METLWQDVKYAVRTLSRSPGFAAVVVITLALGIGANTAVFSITDQVLLRLLPIPRPQELVILRSPGPNPGHTWSDSDDAFFFSYPFYKELRDRNPVFSGLLARFPLELNVAGQGRTERVAGELVSGNYFNVLGVPPALGRVLSADDETAPGANPVTVLSYGYWTSRFGQNSGVLNKPIVVNGTTLTVVGVARSGFTGVQIGQTPAFFIPITMKAQMTPNWNGLDDHKDHWVAILGRLKLGFTVAKSQAGLQAVYHAILESELPLIKISAARQKAFLAKPLLLEPGAHGRQNLQTDARQPLLFLVAMIGLILLIGCANLASLLVARSEARQREIAVRLSLGAGRWRLIRQLLTEALLLAFAGGVAGLVLAWWTLGSLVNAVQQNAGVRGLEARLDYRVLAFAMTLSILTGILFGLAPALRATHLDLQGTLKEQGTSVSASTSAVRFRKWLMVSQVALTAVLLTSAGLFARSLMNLQRLDLGLRADHLIEFSMRPELSRYSPVQTIALCDRMRQGIAALPGVRSVSAAQIAVFTDTDAGANVTVEGYTPQNPEDSEETHVFENWVGPNYFATMGVPLLSGREFTDVDSASSPKVAVVNETFARRFFAGRNPVGLRFALGSGNDVHPDIQIIGFVKDSKHNDARAIIHAFAYFPYAQQAKLGEITFYARTIQDPTVAEATLRKVAESYDPNLPVYNMKTVAEQLDESMFSDRALMFLSVSLAGLASLLAAVGLYGVMAYAVTRRTREIGIRIALGATRGKVASLILREVARLAAVGLAIGLAAAFAIDRLIESQLFGVKASDPVVYVLAAVLLAGVAFLAGSLPARKAAGVDPIVALRYE